MWDLRQLVDRYLRLVAEFGEPVPLAAFGLSEQDTAATFSAFEDDYHISRYLHFSQKAGTVYSVGGQLATHVIIDRGIRELL
jgi:hypothetical protein